MESTQGAIGFQPPATRIMERLEGFHMYLLIMITLITLFVLALIIWVIIRYNSRRNPVAEQFSHNSLVEVIWTVVPVLLLVAIAGPSFSLLFYGENEPDLEMIAGITDNDNPNYYPEAAAAGWVTVKAQGNQWNWTYSFPDETDEAGYPLEFVSNGLHHGLSTDAPSSPEKPRNLAVDYPLVLPANRYIRYQTAASDVIHSFAMPSFGIKTDAVPGRLNEGWFLVEEPGVYYGQCSELCGKDHAFMPIEIRIVPNSQYEQWLETMKGGDFDAAATLVATIDPIDGDTRLASAN